MFTVTFTELICIYVIAQLTDPKDVVFNFIALAIIADFDEMIFDAFDDCLTNLTDVDDDRPLLVIQHTTSISCSTNERSTVHDEEGNLRPLRIRWSMRSCSNKFACFVYHMMRCWYISFYFYFIPYTAIMISIGMPLIFYTGETVEG